MPVQGVIANRHDINDLPADRTNSSDQCSMLAVPQGYHPICEADSCYNDVAWRNAAVAAQ
jgi:5-deoxy-D-glucuronate isomerase